MYIIVIRIEGKPIPKYKKSFDTEPESVISGTAATVFLRPPPRLDLFFNRELGLC